MSEGQDGAVRAKDVEEIRAVARRLLERDFARVDLQGEDLIGEVATAAAHLRQEASEERQRLEIIGVLLRRSRLALARRIFIVAAAVAAGAAAALGVRFSVTLLAAGLGVTAALAGVWISLDDERTDTQALRVLLERRLGAEREYTAALERAVRRWLSNRIDQILGSVYDPFLSMLNPTGLAEIDDPEREISTAASNELDDLIKSMPAGSIGVAGPRGAGKTTVLRRVTGIDRRADDLGDDGDAKGNEAENRPLGLIVDAPVEYEPRDFILHLFARACEEVLGVERVAELRRWDRGVHPGRVAGSWRRYLPMLGPLLFLAGGIVYAAIQSDRHPVELVDLEPYAVAAMAIGAMITYLRFLPTIPGVRRWIRSRRRGGDARNPTATAELRLRQIWFQQSFSTGWSGSLTLPLGTGAKLERGTQLAENQLSLPDIVALYKDFIKLVASERQVRIGIDELDKMDDERARRFLNEIKVVFRVDNCFYLVSVSEDAMSYFERRGLPFRDVFDSSFDEVVRVGGVSYKESRELLRKRVVGLPVQFACLCHILGGGLPREVIRVAREVCDQFERSLSDVVSEIAQRQLERKREAAWIAARRLHEPGYAAVLGDWLRSLGGVGPTTAEMLERCRNFGIDFIDPLAEPPYEDPSQLAEHREALAVALELASFAYFVTSLEEFMSTLTNEKRTTDAIENGMVEGFAEARQSFGRGPSEAWGEVSGLREEIPGLEPVPLSPLRSMPCEHRWRP